MIFAEPPSDKEERELCRTYRNVCRLISEKLTFREKILFYFTKEIKQCSFAVQRLLISVEIVLL